nr:hypothetical protein [Tanacetum cinerariifolium]
MIAITFVGLRELMDYFEGGCLDDCWKGMHWDIYEILPQIKNRQHWIDVGSPTIIGDRNEGSGDWDTPEYKDTAGSGGKKEHEALGFHKMYTEEDSDRYIAQYFVNGLYAPDGEINLEENDNLISNNYAVKLCLEYKVRKRKKLVKKELMVSLRGEIYFVQFIINPEEDRFELGLIFGRLEGLINENALADTGSDIKTMPYRIYEQLGEYDYEAGSSCTKRSRQVETVEEALLLNVHHEFLEWSGCSRKEKSHYNTRLQTLLPKLIYSPHIMDWQLLHKIGCIEEIDHMLKISLKEAQSNEEIFFFVAWSKKIISFRLGGRSLRSDENFNAREYWERISTDRDLHLSRSSITSVRFSILRVLHKMITYELCQRATGYEKIQKNDLWLLSMFEARHQNGYANVAWVIAKWIKRKGARSQKDSQICCGQFISKIDRKSKVLTEEIVRTLSTSVYCRDLDMTTLRELIDFEDRLIPDILVDDVPRVATQRALRVDYNPPGYAQPQYDQYYQQYYPQQPPPQQHDDEENE